MDPDSLDDVGGVEMDEDEVVAFLHEQGVGVLSLADEGDAYGVPMSYGYDDRTLYFMYLRPGEESEKEQFTEATDSASFLVMDVDSRADWRSVVARGPVRQVDESEWETASEAIGEDAWYPDVFRRSSPTRGVLGYAMRVEELTGRKGGNAAPLTPADR